MSKLNRFDYVKYDGEAQGLSEAFKKNFTILATMLELMPSTRASSLALTKLEETYMWVGKAIRDNQIARNGSASTQEERSNS